MGDRDVLNGWVQVFKVLTITNGPLAVLLSALRLESAVRVAAGVEVSQRGRGLVEASLVDKIEEGDAVEESSVSAMVDRAAPLGPDSVLENGLADKVAEMAPATPDVAKEATASDGDDVSASARMVSAEDSVSVLA